MNRSEAIKKLEAFLVPGSVVKSIIEEGDHFLLIAHTPDPLEGRMDPFYRVEKSSGAIRDYSPQNYSDPGKIINRLLEVYVEEGLSNG